MYSRTKAQIGMEVKLRWWKSILYCTRNLLCSNDQQWRRSPPLAFQLNIKNLRVDFHVFVVTVFSCTFRYRYSSIRMMTSSATKRQIGLCNTRSFFDSSTIHISANSTLMVENRHRSELKYQESMYIEMYTSFQISLLSSCDRDL